jgi:alpha-1,2-mannosyltransferase
MQKSRVRVAFGVLAVFCFALVLPELKGVIDHHQREFDFEVYYTAATLVRDNLDIHVYDGAGSGQDPQLRFADESTTFAQKAHELGIDSLRLYVYPPTLADLMVPLTVVPLRRAEIIWQGLNLLALAGIALMLSRMVGMKTVSVGTVAIAAFLLIFRPTSQCYLWGQITILLLFLVAAGLTFYGQGRKVPAALMFALAASIKITPLIVIVPLIAWRDRKSLRNLALCLIGILGAIWLVNGRDLIVFYGLRVLPSMSNGIVTQDNRSLGSVLQLCWRVFVHGSSPKVVIWATKILSAGIICYSGWISSYNWKNEAAEYRLAVVAEFFLLSCCLSPVAWLHAYMLAVPAIVILCKKAFDGDLRGTEALLLMAFILSLNCYRYNTVAPLTGGSVLHYVEMLPPIFALMTPVFGLTLALVGLRRLNTERGRILTMGVAKPLKHRKFGRILG